VSIAGSLVSTAIDDQAKPKPHYRLLPETTFSIDTGFALISFVLMGRTSNRLHKETAVIGTKAPQITTVTSSRPRTLHLLTVRSDNVLMKSDLFLLVLRLDCLSCVLTVCSTILVGRRCWEGWILGAVNSLIICVIALRTAQLGLIPANLFCIALYTVNLRAWRNAEMSRPLMPPAGSRVGIEEPRKSA
jgi:hypothetical protein